MNRKFQLILGATWQYLNQPLFDEELEAIWHVQSFWYLYQLQLLEACWEKEIGSETYYT
jgi:hypothetical protein